MPIRKPIVAGSFYPRSARECVSQIDECLSTARTTVALGDEKPKGAIVPHAGWMCSGAVAAAAMRAVAEHRRPETVVLFGAVHAFAGAPGAMYDRGAWETPLGQIEVDDRLADAVLAAGELVRAEPVAHEQEHSLEVEAPFIQRLFGQVKILPILVLPGRSAADVGRQVARGVAECGRDVVYVGSTDLTHYGPRYRFTPQGRGRKALRWAKETNDRRILDLIERLEADKIVEEAMTHHNACGAGAVAATLAAAQAAGATQAKVLWHTTSEEVLESVYGPMEDSVGYAGVILL